MHSTHSLNLLPPEDQTTIGHERLRRYVVVCCGGIAVLLSMGIILLLPTYFFLYFQNRGIVELLTARLETSKSAQAEETELRVTEVNETLRRLQTDYALRESALTSNMQTLFREAPAGITLLTFSYEKETSRISLRGTATTRNDLLQFISAIRNHPLFEQVESPVENILQDRDVSFTLSFSVKQTQTP